MINDDIDNVLEIYFNQSDDYDYIADICNLSILDVANIINDYLNKGK